MTSRRQFMLGTLGAMVPASKGQEPITWLDSESFVVEIGCLVCGGGRQPDASWELMVNVFVRTGGWLWGESRRKVPSEILRQRLIEVGLRTDFDDHPVYPSLVARLHGRVDPNQILRQLETVLRSTDQALLYVEPESGRVDTPGR